MSQLLLTPREHGNSYPYNGHEGAKVLNSCGIPCAIWGEDLLIHFGVPTVIFDHFFVGTQPRNSGL
jgi:hypothetical protein